jgi:hypothetical protein
MVPAAAFKAALQALCLPPLAADADLLALVEAFVERGSGGAAAAAAAVAMKGAGGLGPAASASASASLPQRVVNYDAFLRACLNNGNGRESSA